MPLTRILNQQLEPADTWEKIEAFAKGLDPERKKTEWIFRGQDCNVPPKTALERTIEDFNLNKDDAFVFEFTLNYRFLRNLHIVDPSIPKSLDTVELLALMRHYGAPTRLLDFTYSFYLAVFFAVETLKQGADTFVWAIDALWLQKRALNHLGLAGNVFMPGKYDEEFKRYFMSEERNDFKPIVYQITPDRLNQRLSVQQGTFLCPSDIRLSFEDNLGAIIKNEDQNAVESHIKLLKISASDPFRKEILGKLSQMNISRASLFPGLDGFAQSIKTALLFPSTIEIYREKRFNVRDREKEEQLRSGKTAGRT